MELMKKHKLHILLPVVLVLITLIGSLLFTAFFSGGSAENHCKLGQQYLNDLNYAAAILEFSNAITLDPTNTEARVGLSQAYSQSGNPDFAAEVLQDVIDENHLDPELADVLIDIYIDSGKYVPAVQLISKLIEQTDEEKYYARLEELLRIIYSAPHPYSAGKDHALAYLDERVQSMGYNTLGQLGTMNDLGKWDSYQPDFANAMFPGTAKSVYCAGRTSYVIDSNNNLWAAGENRWGQLGLSFGSTLPEGGWVQLTDSGDIAQVAGSNGVLFVLKFDGTLWQSGAGVGQQWKLCSNFDMVLRLSHCDGRIYVLTGEGKLYESYTSDNLRWRVLGSDVAEFCACSYGVLMVDSEGYIKYSYGMSVPEDWTWSENGKLKPTISIRRVATNSTVTVFWTTEGKLYVLDNNADLQEIAVNASVTGLYSEQNSVTAVLEDGSMLVWKPYEDVFTNY